MTASRLPDVDRLPEAVLVVDGDGEVVAANTGACRLTGWATDHLVGRRCSEIVEWRPPEGQRRAEGGWPASARLRSATGLAPQAATVHRRDGDTVPVTATGTYLRGHDGSFEGAIISLVPLPRRNRRSPGGVEIVSTVSHELRSPLTSVKGYTSLMLNRWDRLPDDQKKMMLEQVNHDADRVTRLITELLDISRLETGRLILRRQLVDLARLASSVIQKVTLEYPELDAASDFPASLPKVYADPDKIEQVLTNLVENACKYASPQGLRLSAEVTESAVSVSVTDRGEGIPPSDLPKVFTKFFRREVGRPTGSGLGLWISRGLVEAHGGELTAQSILGQGSTFRFTLPLIDLDALQSQ